MLGLHHVGAFILHPSSPHSGCLGFSYVQSTKSHWYEIELPGTPRRFSSLTLEKNFTLPFEPEFPRMELKAARQESLFRQSNESE